MQKLKFYYKPDFFQNTWIVSTDLERPYDLRRASDFYIHRLLKLSYARHPVFYFPKIWCNLDDNLKIMERSDFIIALKSHFFSKLNVDCLNNSCSVCDIIRTARSIIYQT